MSPYLPTVKTAFVATAVRIVHSSLRGSRDIEHIGSAHDDVQLEVLKAARRGSGWRPARTSLTWAWSAPILRAGRWRRAAADHRLADGPPGGRPGDGYRVLGFEDATGGDEVFRQLVLARIIEPVSKLDNLRVRRKQASPLLPPTAL